MTQVVTRARVGLMGGLLAVVVLAGCQSGAPGTPVQPLTAAELDLLTRSGSYIGHSMLVSRAEQLVIRDCMTAKGFDYRVDPAPAPPPSSDDERIVNMADRQRHGYGLRDQGDETSSGEDPAPSAGPAGGFRLALDGSDGERRRFTFPGGGELGLNTTGCTADAHARLYGGDLAAYAAVSVIPQRLNLSLSKPVQADAALAALMRQWADCMAASGHGGYADPEDAAAKLGAEYTTTGNTPEMREREIAVAVADGRCALRLRMPTRILDLRKQHAAAFSADEQDRLRGATELWLAAVGRAEELVAGG